MTRVCLVPPKISCNTKSFSGRYLGMVWEEEPLCLNVHSYLIVINIILLLGKGGGGLSV